MSRLEEAMEKARRLRESQMSPQAQVSAGTAVQTHDSGQQSPADSITITSPRLVAANNYNMPIAEEYRKLKSSILQLTRGETFENMLMVTSSLGNEGKSLTALNLAISIAQEFDHQVLLVDADLRNPSICKYLGIEEGRGLVDCLVDGADFRNVLVDTGLGNLQLLPAGRKVVNPVELLSSQKMRELSVQMKNFFPSGYIIFDTSPVLPFAEARVIGNLVDGVVFVVKQGGTSLKNISDAIRSLGHTDILGIVYNKATTEGLAGGYHYYYYDYDYKPRTVETPRESGFWSKLLRRAKDR